MKILEDVKEDNPMAYIPDDAEEIYVYVWYFEIIIIVKYKL